MCIINLFCVFMSSTTLIKSEYTLKEQVHFVRVASSSLGQVLRSQETRLALWQQPSEEIGKKVSLLP